jgi:hypothetical protein
MVAVLKPMQGKQVRGRYQSKGSAIQVMLITAIQSFEWLWDTVEPYLP